MKKGAKNNSSAAAQKASLVAGVKKSSVPAPPKEAVPETDQSRDMILKTIAPFGLDMATIAEIAAEDFDLLLNSTNLNLPPNTMIPPNQSGETFNQISEDYICGLLEDELVMDEKIRSGLSPRLAEFERHFEKLDNDRFLSERAKLIAAGGPLAAKLEATDALWNSINSKFNVSQSAYSALQGRLAEMRQKMNAGRLIAAHNAAQERKKQLAKVIPKVKAGEIPEEGEGFNEDDDFEEDEFPYGSADEAYINWPSDGPEFEGEEDGMIPSKAALKAADGRIFGPSDIVEPTKDDLELVTKAEAELDSAFSILADPSLSMEDKMNSVKNKFCSVLEQDLYWRSTATKATRKVQSLRLEKKIAAMERDRVNAINSRLQTFCRELQAENRRYRAESLRIDEAVKAAISTIPTITSTEMAPPTVNSNPPSASNKKKSPKNNATSNIGEQVKPVEKPKIDSFKLPPIPSREDLLKESPELLVNRVHALADLFLLRERSLESLLSGLSLETTLHQTQLCRQQTFLQATCTKLEQTERRLSSLTRSESDLKGQVRQYVEKFRQVEETLVKSNELFGTFRGEMEQMSQKLTKFERENNQMHIKCATLSKNIIEMADERARLTQSLETEKAKRAKLEALCRSLQADRNANKISNAAQESGANEEVPSTDSQEPPKQSA